MTKELHELLLTYLGELMADKDSCFDWIEKDLLIRKINAVNLLLGFDYSEETTLQKLRDIIADSIKSQFHKPIDS